MGLTPELQKYYEARLSMMSEQGWADLVEDVRNMERATNTLDSVPDERTLLIRKGELNIIRWLIHLKESSERTYEELQNEPPKGGFFTPDETD